MSDQACPPTKVCVKSQCNRAQLSRLGEFWCCPKCGASYGTNPHPDLTDSPTDTERIEAELYELLTPYGFDRTDWLVESELVSRIAIWAAKHEAGLREANADLMREAGRRFTGGFVRGCLEALSDKSTALHQQQKGIKRLRRKVSTLRTQLTPLTESQAEVEALRRECKYQIAALNALTDAAKKIVKEVEVDDRFHDKPALVQINAPLALIQVDLAAKYCTAKRILAALDHSREEQK